MSTSSNSSLKVLYTRRSSMKGQITKFKNYVDKINKSIDEITDLELVELNLKLSKIECLSTRFDNLQTEIEVLNSENLLAEIDERELIEDSLIQCIAEAKNIIKQNESCNNKSFHECSEFDLAITAGTLQGYLKREIVENARGSRHSL
ncbi:hypothetical protein ACJJTC_019306 [Scirpophaga incertulas]